VEQLLERGDRVKIVVRSTENLPEKLTNNENVSVIHASILDLSDSEIAQHVNDCDALASCLGHNLSFKGMFGPPYRLVTDATRRLCNAVKASNPKQSIKFVLMNTAGNSNRDLDEQISFGQKCVIWLLRLLLPPHIDNEKAADYLRVELSQNDETIEWVAVRPDNLTDDSEVTDYAVHPSPIRSPIFDAGLTSRINVAHFMAKLITDDDTWKEWKGKMPVIYNKELESPLPKSS
jgi:nucleoside-diphosphate-sugar epimerase